MSLPVRSDGPGGPCHVPQRIVDVCRALREQMVSDDRGRQGVLAGEARVLFCGLPGEPSVAEQRFRNDERFDAIHGVLHLASWTPGERSKLFERAWHMVNVGGSLAGTFPSSDLEVDRLVAELLDASSGRIELRHVEVYLANDPDDETWMTLILGTL